MTAQAPDAPRRQLPEEQFWVRYSPHHEFPLSSVTSAALHILVLVFLALVAWVAIKLGFGDESRPPTVTPVAIDAGGGGSKVGVEEARGKGGVPLDDAVANPPDPTKPVADGELKDLSNQVGSVDRPKLPEMKNDARQRLVPDAEKAARNLGQVAERIRRELLDGQSASRGRGGEGKNGGKGPGNGPGVGPGDQAGKAPTERQKRLLRWSMTFSTQNGDDYLRQLRDLKPGSGAILAIPVGNNQFEVIRDLSKKPATGKVEDLTTIQKIFWVDNQPDSVANLARALGIQPPQYFVAFFPTDLENELIRLERKMANGAREDDIEETRFDIVRTDEGYKPRAVSVRLKK
jgi:hypothetical protein